MERGRAVGPSPHLSWGELACKDGSPYPPEWRSSRAAQLAAEFEAIRAACGGRPIAVLSAYRTPEYNRAVGGARLSQHVQGRALDLRPPRGMSVDVFHETILGVAREAGSFIRGVGKYPAFVHVDVRPTRALVRWASTNRGGA